MTSTDLDDLANDLNFGGPELDEQDAAEPRHPFVFVIDTSYSTGVAANGAQPDIERINAAIHKMYRRLKNPGHNDPLALTNHQVDLCVISYNTDVFIEQKWVAANELPDTAPIFASGGGTSMGRAIMAAMDVAMARLQRYKKDGVPKSGKPFIVHFSDGEPTDAKFDSPDWRLVQARVKELVHDQKKIVLWNFIAPNGYVPSPAAPLDEVGNPMSGAEQVSRWFGSDVIKPIDDGADNFTKLTDFLIKTITQVSQQAGAQREINAGLGLKHFGEEAHG